MNIVHMSAPSHGASIDVNFPMVVMPSRIWFLHGSSSLAPQSIYAHDKFRAMFGICFWSHILCLPRIPHCVHLHLALLRLARLCFSVVSALFQCHLQLSSHFSVHQSALMCFELMHMAHPLLNAYTFQWLSVFLTARPLSLPLDGPLHGAMHGNHGSFPPYRSI